MQEIDSPINGDCLRASIASLLEVPLRCVPHFLELFPYNQKWFDELVDWLPYMGYKLEGWFGYQGLRKHKGKKGHVIVSVDTPHPECMHACIYSLEKKRIIHDPDYRKLYENNDVEILGYYYIEAIT